MDRDTPEQLLRAPAAGGERGATGERLLQDEVGSRKDVAVWSLSEVAKHMLVSVRSFSPWTAEQPVDFSFLQKQLNTFRFCMR